MYVCMYVCMYACMHACMHACMYVCIYSMIVYIFNVSRIFEVYLFKYYVDSYACYPTSFTSARPISVPRFWIFRGSGSDSILILRGVTLRVHR